ncbi:hypothetical protein PSENEW3_00001441 [Picochlorum sp. SENEW3]|nr:hypothetical protein PSENEW3_00001441 [Picochlorum sp. SENEW3]
MVKTLLSFEDIDSSLISLTALSNAAYSAQMFFLPKQQHQLYYEDHVNECPQWQQWWATGLAMNTVSAFSLTQSSLTKAQKKVALKACGANNALAAGIIAKQMADGDFKKPIGFATIGFIGLQSVACFARAFRKDDEDGEK